MKKILCLIIAAVVAMGITGCAVMTQSEQRILTGTAGGAATGAVIGAIAGNAGMRLPWRRRGLTKWLRLRKIHTV